MKTLFIYCLSLFALESSALPIVPPAIIVQCPAALTMIKSSTSSRSYSYSGHASARMTPYVSAAPQPPRTTTSPRVTIPSATAILSPALRDYTIHSQTNSAPRSTSTAPPVRAPSLRYNATPNPDLTPDPRPSRMRRVFNAGKFVYQKYRVWHRSRQASGTTLKSANSSRVPYTDDDLGNPLVNAQDPWIAASLRLEPGATTAQPQTPTVTVLSDSQEDADRKDKELARRLADLNAQIERLDRLIQDDQNSRTSRDELAETQAEYKSEARGAADEFQAASHEFERDHQTEIIAAETLAHARAGSVWCHVHIFCGWATSAEQAAETTAHQNEIHAQTILEQTRNRRDERERAFNEISNHLAAVDASLRTQNPDTVARQTGERDHLREEVQRTLNERRALSGFTPINLGTRQVSQTLKACARPLRYHAVDASDEHFRHPFFAVDVDQSLQPNPDAELVVCADDQNRVRSVHILENDREVLTSLITSTEDHQVEEIQIQKPDGAPLEDHQWQKTDGGKVRYGLTFYKTEDPNETPTSVYADEEN